MTTLARLLAPLARAGDPPLPDTTIVRRLGGDCRLALTYRWSRSEPILPWIMLNPAYAGTRTAFDLTARRVMRFSWRWGFGGAVLLNLVPFIAPRTADLRNWLRWHERDDWAARDQLWANHDALRDELTPHDAAMAAWGTTWNAWSTAEAYACDLLLEQAFDAINATDGPRTALLRTFCLGMTAGRRPLHPMARGRCRAPDATQPIPFPHHPGTIVGLEAAA